MNHAKIVAHCEGAQYDKQKSHTSTSSQFSPVLYDMLRSNATMTGEVAGKLLQLYLHSLPGKTFVKQANEPSSMRSKTSTASKKSRQVS
jgi:hypothetical protein